MAEEGIVIRKEEKKHHGIGWIVIAAGAGAAIIVLAVLSGFLSVTDTGFAGPPGVGSFAGETVIPSDEDGKTVYSKDKSFSVTTIGKGQNSKADKDFYLGDEPARIEDVSFIGVKSETDERITIRLDYKMVPERDISGRRAIDRVYVSQTELKDLTRETYKSGYIFCLFSESQRNEKEYYQYQTTRYFQIRSYSSREDYIAYTPVYKVSYT